MRNTSFSAKDFRDADHLNSDGAKKLSQMIDLEVNKIIDSLQWIFKIDPTPENWKQG